DVCSSDLPEAPKPPVLAVEPLAAFAEVAADGVLEHEDLRHQLFGGFLLGGGDAGDGAGGARLSHARPPAPRFRLPLARQAPRRADRATPLPRLSRLRLPQHLRARLPRPLRP